MITLDTHVLSVLVENHSGVLSRIAGLFSRRGYNIESLTAGLAEENFSRVTIVTTGDDSTIEQIKKQLEKLVVVVKVIELEADNAVCRELALIKINVSAEKRPEIVGIVDVFRANIIDLSTTSVTIEIIGTNTKIDAFIDLVKPYGIKEVARTGITGLERSSVSIRDYIDNEEE